MAVSPLFQTRDQILAALRLTATAAKDSPAAVIDAGISSARLEFWRRLGGTQVKALQTLAVSENPDPDDNSANLKMLAILTEQLVVRSELLLTMPTCFMDASASLPQQWNDEAGFRTGDNFQRTGERKALLLKIAENMDLLAGSESAGAESTMQGTTIGPTDANDDPAYLGEQVFNHSLGIFK